MVDMGIVASAVADGVAITSYPMAARAEGGGESPVNNYNNSNNSQYFGS
jgi:hypothetical protein